MLRKMLWARRRMGRSVKSRKPKTAVKKRHMNTGTIAAIHPRRMSIIIIWLCSMLWSASAFWE